MKASSFWAKLFLLLLLSFSIAGHAETVTTTGNATTLTNTIAGAGVTITGGVITATDASQTGTFTGFIFPVQ